MDRQKQIRHKQLKNIALNMFKSRFARKVKLYRPDVEGGEKVLTDEEHFEEKEATGTLDQQEASIVYIPQPAESVRTRIIPCKITDDGKFDLVRGNEAGEFQQDKLFRFLIDDDVPTQSLIQFQQLTELEGDDAEQTITLIKVDEQPVGQTPIAGKIHVFAWFQGEMES